MHKRKGFTLPEVLVSVIILVIVCGVIYMFFMVGIGNWQMGIRYADIQGQLRLACDAMVDELKNSTRSHPTRGITILPAPNNIGIIFYLPQKDANGDVLLDLNNEISWPAGDNDYIEYKYLSGTRQLVREDLAVRQGTAAARVLANDVQSVEFIDAGLDSSLYQDELNIVLSLQKTTPRGRVLDFTMRSTVKLRN